MVALLVATCQLAYVLSRITESFISSLEFQTSKTAHFRESKSVETGQSYIHALVVEPGFIYIFNNQSVQNDGVVVSN